ncbi:hypothetical protein JOC94_004728 [Bacillus thermophilus]|uniref:Uncharacterized protein n=1 Tax=Siminovitchia thermophila TaxID=1245522 RepID=A0ABS2RDF7_9BACI|nr:hypothetical protein [Siminovitchia thermophila]MBM7717697.1 hypothetical protein [Siminovitchia thermophila]ONK23358.1 hypothetical protein BLX87_11140 [Bacillus sp. VT-16-64]
MSNPKITNNEYSAQMILPLEVKVKPFVTKTYTAPKFKTYNNRQSFAILDAEGLGSSQNIMSPVWSMR